MTVRENVMRARRCYANILRVVDGQSLYKTNKPSNFARKPCHAARLPSFGLTNAQNARPGPLVSRVCVLHHSVFLKFKLLAHLYDLRPCSINNALCLLLSLLHQENIQQLSNYSTFRKKEGFALLFS